MVNLHIELCWHNHLGNTPLHAPCYSVLHKPCWHLGAPRSCSWPPQLLALCLQSPWPRVQYAAASALAMLAEGHPAVCESIMSHEGPQALAKMLRSNVGHARQAAAEAMQVGLGCLVYGMPV